MQWLLSLLKHFKPFDIEQNSGDTLIKRNLKTACRRGISL